MVDNSLDYIREEFGGFVRRTGDAISKELKTIPDQFDYSFIVDTDLPIPSKENKWKIGKPPNEELKVLDKYLSYFVKYYYKYDFEGFTFYCYLENGRIYLESHLSFSKKIRSPKRIKN